MHNYTGVGWRRTTFGCVTEADSWAGPDLSENAIVHLPPRPASYVSLISPTTKIERLSLAARSSSQQTKIMSLISSDSSHGGADGRKLSPRQQDRTTVISKSCHQVHSVVLLLVKKETNIKAPKNTILGENIADGKKTKQNTRSTSAIKQLPLRFKSTLLWFHWGWKSWKMHDALCNRSCKQRQRQRKTNSQLSNKYHLMSESAPLPSDSEPHC